MKRDDEELDKTYWREVTCNGDIVAVRNLKTKDLYYFNCTKINNTNCKGTLQFLTHNYLQTIKEYSLTSTA